MTALAGNPLTRAAIRRWSGILGYAGLLPFLPALVLPWLQPPSLATLAQNALLAYGAIILSFVGALHWQAGLHARSAGESAARLIFSVLPALLGWLALLLQPVPAYVFLITGFLLVYGFDRRWRDGDAWFLELRRRLTAGVVLCLFAGLGAALTMD